MVEYTSRPQILHPWDADEAGIIADFRKDPQVQVHDTLLLQLRDLIVTRNPQKTLSNEEIDCLVKEHLEGISPDEYGVWVYYPWSRILVHLLDEEEFSELRTNRNKYKISPEEQDLLSSLRIGVVGLSVGNAVATTIALEHGCGELRIADFDTLDTSNLNRIQTSVQNLGVPKVCITSRGIAEVDPFLKVTCFSEGVTEANISDFLFHGGKLDLIIDECDSLDIKVRIRFAAREHRIAVIMATSDRGMLDIERFDTEPDRQIFHGFIGEVNPEELRDLSTEEKLPFVLDILGADTMSTRSRGSLLEIGQSIKTWSQLASGVMLGGAVIADVARRIALGEKIPSGRYFVDLDELIPASVKAEPSEEAVQPSPIHFSKKVTVESQVDAGRMCLKRIAHTFRALPIDMELIKSLVTGAITAPSGGNMQPWLWLYKEPVLLLVLDTLRSGTILDFRQTSSIAALGAAAENIVLMAHSRGLEVRVRMFPDQSCPNVVAAFGFHSDWNSSSSEPHIVDELREVIGARQTNRRLGPRQELPSEKLEAIRAAAHSVRGADLKILSSVDELARLGDILGKGDRLRLLDQKLHREMMGEMRWTEEEVARRDGISVADLGLSLIDKAGLELCRRWDALAFVRRWGGGAGFEKASRKAMNAASAAALLTMPDASRADYFEGGRAMQRAWLTATSLDVALQPMAALPYLFARHLSGDDDNVLSCEMKHGLGCLRPMYEKLFELERGRGEILLFRLSQVESPGYRALRRSVDEVLYVVL